MPQQTQLPWPPATLAAAVDANFRPFAGNPLGGFGPTLLKVHQQVWSARKEDALRMGVQLRAIESQEQRALLLQVYLPQPDGPHSQ